LRHAIQDGERVRKVVAKLKQGLSSGEERLDPVAQVGWEALVMEDLCDAPHVDVVEEA